MSNMSWFRVRQKKLLSMLLAVLLLSGIFPMTAIAAQSGTDGLDQYVVNLVTDSAASPEIPAEFGTSAADGRVFTDKNVSVNGDEFEVTLSALAQEYIVTSASAAGNRTAADVALVLDMSSSMTAARVLNMTNAVNKAVDIIMAANAKNRVGVYYFGTPASVGTVLPLASYISGSTGNPSPENRYITVSGTSIYANAGLTKTLLGSSSSTTVEGTHINVTAGTTTQLGLYTGVSALKNDIESRVRGAAEERYPYVLLFTDGDANNAYTNWYSDLTNTSDRGTLRTGSGANGTAEIAALTILTTAKLKDELNDAYETYNGKARDTVWFNVGLLSVTEDTNALSTALLTPSHVESSATGAWKSVYDEIVSITVNNSGGYTQYGVGGTPGYVFADDYIYYATDSDLTPLNTAFSKLGELVEEATQEKIIPIDIGDSSTAEVVFTDILGEGLTLTGAPKLGNVTGTVLSVSGTVTTYKFGSLSNTAAYDSATRTLTWTIPAEEIPLIMFENREVPTDGGYTSATPIRLTYAVGVDGSYTGGNLYSNAFSETDNVVTALTAASFTPTQDNPYYYKNIEKYTEEDDIPEGKLAGDLKSSDPKIIGDGGDMTASIAKSSNASGTAAYAQSFAWGTGEASTVFITSLGNNGSLTPQLSIAKSADKSAVAAGDTVTYTITVSNPTNAAISNVVVNDTLPAGVAFVAGSIHEDDIPMVSATFPYSISSVPAKGSVALSFSATVAEGADEADYINTAEIESVGGFLLNNPAADTAKITVGPTYTATVTLTLDGDAYDGRTVTLRQDSDIMYTLTGPDGSYSLDGVAVGTYDVYVDGVQTGTQLVLTDKNESVQIDYYTVTFYDGTTVYTTPAPQIVLSGSKTASPAEPSKSGFTFNSWRTQNGGTEGFDFDTPIIATTNIYASWSANSSSPSGHSNRHTVTFDGQGGSASSSIKGVAPGAKITAPPDPTLPGYIFTGWYTDPACTIPWDFTQDRVNSDIPLYAGWIIDAVGIPKTDSKSSVWQCWGITVAAFLLGGAAIIVRKKNERDW